jgi:hypothetical protein
MIDVIPSRGSPSICSFCRVDLYYVSSMAECGSGIVCSVAEARRIAVDLVSKINSILNDLLTELLHDLFR